MILGVLRALWMIFWVFWGTITVGGSAVIMAGIFRIRGPVYVRMTRTWARLALWASGSEAVLHGLENVTPGQPFILVANHVSWFDIFAIAAKLPVDYHFVAKKELEKIPVFGLAWRAAGHISIDRGNRESAARSLRKAGQQMREQKSVVVIFAEGTRSRTGRLLPFKKGAFVLAAETGIPIIPTIVTGSFDIMRPDTFVVRPATIHVYFEPAIPAEGGVDQLMQRTRAVFVQRLEDTDSLPPADATPPSLPGPDDEGE